MIIADVNSIYFMTPLEYQEYVKEKVLSQLEKRESLRKLGNPLYKEPMEDWF